LIDLVDQRRFYLAVAALFGLPGLVLGATGAGLGMWVGLTEPTHAGLPPPPVLVGWGLAGLLGLLAWVRLSTAWLLTGQEGLRWLHPAWWYLLGAGMAAHWYWSAWRWQIGRPGTPPCCCCWRDPRCSSLRHCCWCSGVACVGRLRVADRRMLDPASLRRRATRADSTTVRWRYLCGQVFSGTVATLP